MKKILLAVFCLLPLCYTSAQIGVYTESPSQLFHIDAANNNSQLPPTSANMTDDIVFTTDGKLGIGTDSPDAKLHLNGSFRMNDGTQTEAKLLISMNNTGLAKWGSVKLNKTANWQLSGNITVSNTTAQVQAKGTTTLTDNEIPGLANGTNGLKIPKGRYIIIANGDVAGVSEYGIFTVKSSAGIDEFSASYCEWLGGATFLLDLTGPGYADPETLTLYFKATGTGNNYYEVPPYTKAYWYSFSIILI